MNQSTDDILIGAKQIVEHLRRSGLQWLPKSSEDWSTSWSSSEVDLDRLSVPRAGSRGSETTAKAVDVAVNLPPSHELHDVGNAEVDSVRAGNSERSLSSGVRSWERFQAPPANSSTLTIADDQWVGESLPLHERLTVFQSLQTQVLACRKCEELACSRKQTVFGVGALDAKVAFLGEAPGAEEDRQGEPFVGAAGQLLDKIIAAMKLKREDVYILNSLKCRPPGNRTPVDEEIANCRPFFESQLDVIQPEFIVCLGAVAARAVLQSTDSVGRLRGRFHRYRRARVLVTYHPAYLLKNESAKKLVWDDMQLLMKTMGLS